MEPDQAPPPPRDRSDLSRPLVRCLGAAATIAAPFLVIFPLVEPGEDRLAIGVMLGAGGVALFVLLRLLRTSRRANRAGGPAGAAGGKPLTLDTELARGRPHLAEMVLSCWLGIGLLAFLKLAFGLEPADLTVVGCLYFGLALLGNFWAWSTANCLGVTGLGRRLGLMLLGLLALPAFIGTPMLGIALLWPRRFWMRLFDCRPPTVTGWLVSLLAFLAGLAVSIAVYRLDRAAKAAGKRAPGGEQ